MAGRKTAMSDPDLGTITHTYDTNGNVLQSVDPRGAAGTVYAAYDGLDRPLWRNTTNSPTGAYQTYTYDETAGGNLGIGHLTSERFVGSQPVTPNQGSRSYVYDARDQVTSSTLAFGTSVYTVSSTYDDAGHRLTQTYPSGNVVTNTLTAEGWLSGVSVTIGTTTTQLFTNADYQGPGGATQHVTSAQVGNNTYTANYGFDALLRPTDIKLSQTLGAAVPFRQTRVFDGAGNVTDVSTTMPAGTDNQGFCYDALDRLTWAGTSGARPCGTAVPAGTLTAAAYTHSFSYDNLGRLTSGPQGSYTYGDPAHLHAATGVGSTYTAAYDAAGNMACRAPSASVTCAGATPNGAQLTYDNEGTLGSWKDPVSGRSADFLYDNQGDRVMLDTYDPLGAWASTSIYVDNLEQISQKPGVPDSTTPAADLALTRAACCNSCDP